MPRSRSATTPPARGAQRRQPERGRLGGLGIRWDRQLRLIMLGVLGLVGWVGVHAALNMLATRSQALQEESLVQSLVGQNRALEQEARSLSQPATIIRDARALGMVRVGERGYVVTGLSGN
jgi:cell division protein FtsB